MAEPKIKAPESIQNLPECIACFANIENHANGVFGSFEVKSAEAMEKQDDDFTEHLKKQDAKYDVFLERSDKRESRRSNANVLILTLFASVIAYSYIQQNEFENKINTIENTKADKTEYVTKPEFEVIIQQGDEYNKNKFVKKTEITADTFSYPMNKKRLFGEVSRGSEKLEIPKPELKN